VLEEDTKRARGDGKQEWGVKRKQDTRTKENAEEKETSRRDMQV